MAADAITDETVSLREVSPTAAAQLGDGLLLSNSAPEKLRSLRAAIESCWVHRECDSAMAAAVAWLATHPRGRIAELSSWLGLSSRQLDRRFLAGIGCTPKTFQRVVRSQRALDTADRPHRLDARKDPLAMIAFEAVMPTRRT